MRDPWLKITLLLALLIMAASAVAATTNPMVSAMQAMVDAMSDYVDNRAGSSFGPGGRLGRPPSDETSDLLILYRNMPGAEPRSAASRTPLLDGIWLERNGNAMMIRDGFIRLYASSYAHFEDAELTLTPPMMSIRSLDSDRVREFQYAYKSGRLILKGPDGNLLLYRRMDMDRWLPKGR